MMEVTDDEKSYAPQKKKPCRTITFACWLAFLGFVSSIINVLVQNKNFWDATNQFIVLYHMKINGTRDVCDCEMNKTHMNYVHVFLFYLLYILFTNDIF